MKNRFFILAAIFSLAVFSQCSDDDNSGENWAAGVAGTYNGLTTKSCDSFAPFGSSTFSRAADKKLTLQGNSGSGDAFCLDSITMTSSTTFTANERDYCTGTTMTGSGAFNGNTVNFVLDYSYCIFTVQASK